MLIIDISKPGQKKIERNLTSREALPQVLDKFLKNRKAGAMIDVRGKDGRCFEFDYADFERVPNTNKIKLIEWVHTDKGDRWKNSSIDELRDYFANLAVSL